MILFSSGAHPKHTKGGLFMKKRTKLFSGILMASMMLGTVAFASTDTFAFYLSPGSRQSSDNVSKSDTEQRAYVTTTSGNLGPSPRGPGGVDGRIWYRVRYANENFATESSSITEYTSITLDYLNKVGSGGSYHLNGQQDSSDPSPIKVIGRWTP